jgi:hypothetical protein
MHGPKRNRINAKSLGRLLKMKEHNMVRQLLIVLGMLSFVVGCGEKQQAPPVKNPPPASPESPPRSLEKKSVASNQPILKVSVLRDGSILVDGKASTLASLRPALKKLAEQKGIVYYYREAAQADPPPVAMEVLQAVIDESLPISLCTRPDFSDSVGQEGTFSPGKK